MGAVTVSFWESRALGGDGCTEIGKKAQAEQIKCLQSINVYLPNASRHHIHTGRTESLFTINGLLELLPLSGGSSIGPPQGRSHLETNCRHLGTVEQSVDQEEFQFHR